MDDTTELRRGMVGHCYLDFILDMTIAAQHHDFDRKRSKFPIVIEVC